ncbi:MAG: UDP-N-acetylglucosamine 2-epimerase (non-hydrolyzing) [Thermoplasmata archaeon]|nr:MAG: UDP-N-acetylglucosamine 2-epimerase (non-hydrolyzing) [Thermoplasmata archaeon]
MKVLSVVGTRPNFIKMAPVIRELLDSEIQHVLVHTGQHYDREMSQVFLKELRMPKLDYSLDVGSGSHGYQIGEMLKKLEEVIIKEEPDFVMIPGDTNTSLAGALASSKINNVRTCHIEAGLRSFDKTMPEEINRILIDHCCDDVFCPTITAVENLKKEGIVEKLIYQVGDTMVDACYGHLELAKQGNISDKYEFEEEYYLVTVHRAENTDNSERLEGIVSALSEMERMLIFPIHPRTKKRLIEFKMWDKINDIKGMKLLEPVGYLDFLFLLSNAKLMITDSGGVQKEAFLLNVPCVTLRDNTEWIETLKLNMNVLVGADTQAILEGAKKMLGSGIIPNMNPYGDGKAAKRIVDVLIENEN